jgi:hypothetical protein
VTPRWSAAAFEALEQRLVPDSDAAPVVDDLRLLHDTGEPAGDGVTTDRRVEGLVRNEGSVAFLAVKFRHGAAASPRFLACQLANRDLTSSSSL